MTMGSFSADPIEDKNKGEQKAMEIPMLPTRHNLLESGSYRVKVGEWTIMESIFGRHVVIRFDVLEKGLAHRCVTMCADAELTGGERPSQLYSWISALVFGGEALPEGYSLKTVSLLLREALAQIERIDDGGLSYNRIVQLSPLHGAGRGDRETRGHGDGGGCSVIPRITRARVHPFNSDDNG